MQPLSFFPTSSALGGQVTYGAEVALGNPPSAESVEIGALVEERTELLVRKHTGQWLSTKDQERLTFLTERLDILLSPVSLADRERLEEIERRSERILEEARLRRQRLGLP